MIISVPEMGAGLLSFALVAVLTGAMRRIAIRHRLLDEPRADRRHLHATPYLGGVAITCGPIGAFLLAVHSGGGQMAVIIGAATAVSGLGLIDDLHPLNPAARLLVECLAASAVVAAGVHADPLAGAGRIGWWVDAAGTVVWVVVLTNSFNLLDNSDGAAAAIAMATSPLLAVVAVATGRPGLAALLIAMGLGCAGFLLHNWAPAQIFMGDSGSLFLGFMLATSAVLTCASGAAASGVPLTAAVCALLLLTFVAIVDTCTVIVSRHRAGRSWVQGGTDHIAHRLKLAGLSSGHAAIVLSVTATIAGIVGLGVFAGLVPAVGALCGTVAVAAAVVALAQRVEVYGAPALRTDGAGSRLVTEPVVQRQPAGQPD